ncbi:hypothetical protein [Halorussus sp. MSC15.2]|uniref:hypothetical protein n=1 Tax=Halorussus sp. MSC15.2 TaxID=2283638 RepID=UPI0013D3BE9D|nr:hypothetical protein [Halorussus sp. MSC15.2]NEU58378.1 hypothetical protein [Halorussus sp. MSC15.2]
MTDSDELAAELDALGDRLDRVTALLVVVLVVQLFHVLGDVMVDLTLVALGVGFVGLVAVFLVALGEGL